MNEPQPHLEAFTPSERYRDAVSGLLDTIFADPQSRVEERLPIPETIQHREWIKDGALILAMSLKPEVAAEMQHTKIGQQVSLLRLIPKNGEEGFAARSYLYYRDGGRMQVLDRSFTYEDVEKLRFGTPEGDSFHQSVEEGFRELLYPASDIYYLDFLNDLDSYKGSIEA